MPVSSTDFNGTLADLANYPRYEFDTKARFLREAGRIPIGARGTHAPKLTPREAANLLIACIAADRPRNAVGVVDTYSNLKTDYENTDFPYKFAGDTFGQAVAEILDNPELAKMIKSISVCRPPMSEGKIIIEKDGREFPLMFKYEQPKSGYDFNVIKTFMRFDVTIDNYIIQYLSLLIGPDYDANTHPSFSDIYPDVVL